MHHRSNIQLLAACLVVAMALPVPGQNREPDAAPPGARMAFRDVSSDRGTLVTQVDGASTFMMSGGASWFDMDADGDDDLLVLSGNGSSNLFRNDGAGFTDVIVGSGFEALAGADPMGALPADYDNDGLVDVFVLSVGPNLVFQNMGGNTFQDVAPQLGLDGSNWSAAASWADFDRDGDLDLYVGNYVSALNFPYHVGTPNELFINQGPGASPRFVDQATSLGVSDEGIFGPSVPGFPFTSPQGQPTGGCTLSVSSLDFDEDGDHDIFVGNDFGLWVLPNRHYQNDLGSGGLAFSDQTAASGFAQIPHYNMGISAADYDHDGDWDFYCSNLGDNLLLRNDGGVFTEVAQMAGPVEGLDDSGILMLSSWASVWADFDADGWEDLFVSNGFVPAASFIANDPRAQSHLWMNRGGGVLDRVNPTRSGVGDRGLGRGAATADADGDGMLDLYTMNNGSLFYAQPGDACRLFENRIDPALLGRHWLRLRLRGRTSNGEGIGARVEAELPGGEVLKRQVLGDAVYLSSPSRAVHFGLGPHPVLDRLTVHWPSGIDQDLLRFPVNRHVDLVEPAVTVASIPLPVWSGGILSLQATLQEHEGSAQSAAVFFALLLEDGTPVITQTVSAPVPSSGQAVVNLPLPIPIALHDAFVGTPLELVVYAGAAAALDSAALEFDLP